MILVLKEKLSNVSINGGAIWVQVDFKSRNSIFSFNKNISDVATGDLWNQNGSGIKVDYW